MKSDAFCVALKSDAFSIKSDAVRLLCVKPRIHTHSLSAKAPAAAVLFSGQALHEAFDSVALDDDVFYLFLQKQKIGAELHIYLEEGTYHKRLFRGPNTNDMKNVCRQDTGHSYSRWSVAPCRVCTCSPVPFVNSCVPEPGGHAVHRLVSCERKKPAVHALHVRGRNRGSGVVSGGLVSGSGVVLGGLVSGSGVVSGGLVSGSREGEGVVCVVVLWYFGSFNS